MEDKIVSAIVTHWDFRTYTEDNDDPVQLRLELQMFDGLNRHLSIKLDKIPELYKKFFYYNSRDNGGVMDLMHCRMQCLVSDGLRETPLGKMRTSYKIKAIRHNIHQEWLDVQLP